MLWYSMVWYGMAWYGMGGNGMAWYGMGEYVTSSHAAVHRPPPTSQRNGQADRTSTKDLECGTSDDRKLNLWIFLCVCKADVCYCNTYDNMWKSPRQQPLCSSPSLFPPIESSR